MYIHECEPLGCVSDDFGYLGQNLSEPKPNIIRMFHFGTGYEPGAGGGGGGGALRYRGGPHLRYVFRGVFFLRPPHVRDFVKEGYFFVPRYEVWGAKSTKCTRL